nr:reverse transcriptase domain-containing protein [Tanacetum cinerariifolium]
MFLGYMITPEGIKSCPDKTDAVLQLSSLRTIKEKCIKKSDFHWTSESEQAFKKLKQHLSKLPLLVAPKTKKELIVYMSASYRAISVVLMTERGRFKRSLIRKPRITRPRTELYPNGKASSITGFRSQEALVVFPSVSCRCYYQPTHQTNNVLSDVAGRLQKWSVMLGEHNITYRPRTSVKGQKLFTNGSSCVHGSDAGLILTSPDGTEFTYALRFQFTASNNEAEYEALIAGLWIAFLIGVHNVHVSVDSKLVANQYLGAYVAKEENMVKYLEKVKGMVNGFANFSINQVPRSKNKKADALSKITSTSFAHLSKQVLVEKLKEKSIQEKEVTTMVEEDGPTWITPIIEYLKEWTLPGDRKEARKLCIKARRYKLLEGLLHRRSFLMTWLRCVGPLQADYVIQEIHERSCNMHAGPRSVILIPIMAPWPFYKWGINIDGPFPEGPAKAKFKMTKYYNARVRSVTFRPGDFVYRSNDASHAVNERKLSPKWEGPYELTEALGDGAYKLRSTKGTVLPRTWNVVNLKKCYL